MVIGRASYYKRKDGRWVGQVRVKTGAKTNIKYIYGNQRKIVVEKMNKFISENKALNNRADMLYSDFLTNWLKYKRLSLKDTSYDRLECTVKNQITTELGDYEMCNITDTEITALLSKIKSKYSYSTLIKCYDTLNASFKYACKIDILDKSPMRAIDKPKKQEKIADEDEGKCFTDEELEAFKETIFRQYSNGKYRYSSRWEYVFMMNTGLRLGEMLALRYADIDLENKKVLVNKNLVFVDNRDADGNKLKGGKLQLQTTKSGRERYVPLNELAIQAVEEMKKTNYVNKYSLLVQNSEGNYYSPKNYVGKFYIVLKNANIEKTGIHILRHQFATTLFKEGVEIKIISLYLGHSEISTTERIYIHQVNQRRELQELKICV